MWLCFRRSKYSLGRHVACDGWIQKSMKNSKFWTNFLACVCVFLPIIIQVRLHYSFCPIYRFCLFGYFVHLLPLLVKTFGTTRIFQKTLEWQFRSQGSKLPNCYCWTPQFSCQHNKIAKHHHKVAFEHGAIHCYKVVFDKTLQFIFPRLIQKANILLFIFKPKQLLLVHVQGCNLDNALEWGSILTKIVMKTNAVICIWPCISKFVKQKVLNLKLVHKTHMFLLEFCTFLFYFYVHIQG